MLYLTWCQLSHLDWQTERWGSFILWLRHSPLSRDDQGGAVVLAGPGAAEVRVRAAVATDPVAAVN
jgi:hypothetical protein